MRYGLNLRSPYVYLTILPFIWSTNFVMGKVLVREIPPLTMVTIRFSIAALVLAILLKHNEKKYRKPEKKDFLPLIMMGITGVLGFNSLLYAGLRYTTSTNGAIINALLPVLTAVLSVTVVKEQFCLRKLLGLALSLAGVLLITIQGSWEVLATLHLNPGDVLVFLATASWAVYSIIGRFVLGRFSPLCVTTYSCFFGLILLYPAMFLELNRSAQFSFSWLAVAALIYLGIIASVLSYFLWNRGVQEIGPGKTACFYNLLPLYSAVLASIFLGEKIHWYHLAGGGMVLLGVCLGSIRVDSINQELKNKL